MPSANVFPEKESVFSPAASKHSLMVVACVVSLVLFDTRFTITSPVAKSMLIAFSSEFPPPSPIRTSSTNTQISSVPETLKCRLDDVVLKRTVPLLVFANSIDPVSPKKWVNFLASMLFGVNVPL